MSGRHETLDVLLAQRATEGLSPEESRQLDGLLAEHPDVDAEWADQLVGEMDAEIAAGDEQPLSPSLRRTLISDALEADASDGVIPLQPRRRISLVAWSGWAAAAVVAGLWLLPSADTADGRIDFSVIASAADAVVVPWTPGSDATGRDVSGSVVWSSSSQIGAMRFSGLAANDPSLSQYQLWIFDEGRDDRYPIDGGVFDIPAGSSEVEIAIQAKLPVGTPTLFAVTVEQPGGVVVSDRERIATLAQVGD